MVPLLAGTAFLLLLAIVPRLFSKYALSGLSGRISLNHDHIFPGDDVELAFELINKGLPLPWLEIEIELPYRLINGK
jgi:hypothetical protein